jgi:hypothetical protein
MTGKTRSWLFVALLGALALAFAPACVGDLPSPMNPDDPDPDPNPDPDPDPDPQALNVSGKVMSYATSILGSPEPLPGATVATDGIMPTLSVSASSEGDYMLQDVPVGSLFYIDATVPEPLQFRPTRSEPLMVMDESIESSVYSLAKADATRWYTTATEGELLPNIDPYSFVVVNILDNLGNPIGNVPYDDIMLYNALGEPVDLGPYGGPYFFRTTLDPLPRGELAQSYVYNGMARAVFFNVPPGTYTLVVEYEQNGLLQENRTTIATVAGGATLVQSGGLQGGPQPPLEGQLSFEEHIYPLLQKASQGGLACSNCHTLGGQAGLRQYDRSVEDVYTELRTRPNVVIPSPDIELAMNSLLLMNPLYGYGNHPNATFANAEDPYYQTILLWIVQGALP